MSRRMIKTKIRWTSNQLDLLVQVWEKYFPELKAGRGNDEIYAMMLRELQQGGCMDATIKGIRNRVHNLSGKFRKEANQVIATGIPSQWSLYSKIEKFYEYETPLHLKQVGPPAEYDMSDYLHMDVDLERTIAIHQLARVQHNTPQVREPTVEYLMDENSLNVEEVQELEGITNVEEFKDIEMLKHDEEVEKALADIGLKDPMVTELEAPAQQRAPEAAAPVENNTANSAQPELQANQPPVESVTQPESEAKVESGSSVYLSTDSDSSFDFEVPVTPTSKPSPKSQIFHFNGSYRQAAMDNFLNQLYRNQLYADVMLITCHEGVTCVMPAHRMVLANFSDFFSSILGALKPSTNGSPLTVLLQPDISQPVMQLLLQFMYTGNVSVTQELIGDFLRCGYLLRIRGVWSEEKGDEVKNPATARPSPSKADPPAPPSDSEQSVVDRRDRSTVSAEKRSTTDDTVTDSIISSLPESSDYALKPHEKPRKRRKKPLKRAKRMRSNKSDDDVAVENVEVSSNVGFDLLRSDTEGENANRNEEEKGQDVPPAETVAREELAGEHVVVDGRSAAGQVVQNDRYDDGDCDKAAVSEDGLQIDEEDEHKDLIEYDDGIEVLEEHEIDDVKTLYIETGEEVIETDVEGSSSIVNANTVSNPSPIMTLAPEPMVVPSPPAAPPAPEPEPEMISEIVKVNSDERLQRQPTMPNDSKERKGNETFKIEKHESTGTASTGGEKSEQPPTAPQPVAPHPNAQVTATHPPAAVPAGSSEQPLSLKQVRRVFPPRRHSLPPMQYAQFAAYIKAKNATETSAKPTAPNDRAWYGCRICGKRFTLTDSWLEHVVHEHASDEQLMNGGNNPEERVMMLRCDLCGNYLDTKYQWLQHIVVKHTERYPHFHAELSMGKK